MPPQTATMSSRPFSGAVGGVESSLTGSPYYFPVSAESSLRRSRPFCSSASCLSSSEREPNSPSRNVLKARAQRAWRSLARGSLVDFSFMHSSFVCASGGGLGGRGSGGGFDFFDLGGFEDFV